MGPSARLRELILAGFDVRAHTPAAIVKILNRQTFFVETESESEARTKVIQRETTAEAARYAPVRGVEACASTEAWRSVPGYEGAYEVSDKGRVRSLDRTAVDRRGGKRTFRGRMLTLGYDGLGYPSISVCRSGTSRKRLVHKLVTEAFLGPCPKGKEVCHNDGDHSNSRLNNLRYDTKRSNVLDCMRHSLECRP